MKSAYYNENDPKAARWLREVIAAGLIAPGEVDERSIVDVRPGELAGYTQCHFFAGIGVWSYALRRAGWPDDRPVWTGSCPCQPFSAAGKGEGLDDERHLWPNWFELIRECRPVACFGEQVASPDGLAWLDLVHADLEGEAYTVGAVDTCAAGFGSPHIRQRLCWVADADDGSESHGGIQRGGQHGLIAQDGGTGGMGDTKNTDRRRELQEAGTRSRWAGSSGASEDGRPGPTNGFWRDADWLCCTDGKWRPTRPGSFPLVTGAPARMVRLRGYGNAINAEVATEFVRAYLEVAHAA